MAEESISPEKDIGKAALISCIIGGLIFIIQAYIIQLVWPDYSVFLLQILLLFEVAKLAGEL